MSSCQIFFFFAFTGCVQLAFAWMLSRCVYCTGGNFEKEEGWWNTWICHRKSGLDWRLNDLPALRDSTDAGSFASFGSPWTESLKWIHCCRAAAIWKRLKSQICVCAWLNKNEYTSFKILLHCLAKSSPPTSPPSATIFSWRVLTFHLEKESQLIPLWFLYSEWELEKDVWDWRIDI